MSTTRKKRKSNSNEEPTGKKSRHLSQKLITHVKAVQTERKGNFNYFGKSGPDQTEEKLTVSWLDLNHMGRSWRRTTLRGKKGKHLGVWKQVPVGSKIDEKIKSKNPCIAGTQYLFHNHIIILILFTHLFFRCTSQVCQRKESGDSHQKDVQSDEEFGIFQ